MQLPKLSQLKKIKSYFLAIVNDHPIFLLLIFIISLFVYAGYLFIYYGLKAPAPPAQKSNLEIKMELYQKVSGELKQRDLRVQQGTGQNYPDIFR